MTRFLPVLLLCLTPVQAERITVPLRDPARPATVRFVSVNHSATIKAHSASDVIIDTEGESGVETKSVPNGMREILTGMRGLTVEEENNVVTIKPGPAGKGTVTILVPESASVRINGVNGRELRVEGVAGEVNAEVVNASLTIADVSGPVVAHSVNGRLTVSLKKAPESKPMSFTTLNGRIDVTLPAATRADLNIRNQRGATYSDFDLQVTATATQQPNDKPGYPKYRISMENGISAKINGGGPEYSFRSLNGAIYIRKGQ